MTTTDPGLAPEPFGEVLDRPDVDRFDGRHAGVLAAAEEPIEGNPVAVMGAEGEAANIGDVGEVSIDQLLGLVRF